MPRREGVLFAFLTLPPPASGTRRLHTQPLAVHHAHRQHQHRERLMQQAGSDRHDQDERDDAAQAYAAWIPRLLVRTFGGNIAQAASRSGLAIIVGGVLGVVTAGMVGDSLVARGYRAGRVTAMIASGIRAAPFAVAAVAVPGMTAPRSASATTTGIADRDTRPPVLHAMMLITVAPVSSAMARPGCRRDA